MLTEKYKINNTDIELYCLNVISLTDHDICTYDFRSNIDIICTSPPYNINVNYNGYHDNMGEDNYTKFLEEVNNIFYKLLTDHGICYINIFDKPSNMNKLFNRKILSKLVLQNLIIWIKSIAINNVQHGQYKPLNSNFYLNSCFEYILQCRKELNNPIVINRLGEEIGIPYSDKSNINRYNINDLHCGGNCWFVPYETRNKKLIHPASFPIGIPNKCLNLSLSKADLKNAIVMDPFLGSGTTAISAIKNNVKRFIGIDISPEYVTMSSERIKSEFR